MSSTLSHFYVLLFLFLVLSCCLTSGAPSEPHHPGDQASPEQLGKYYSDLLEYITLISRPRFGKRWEEVVAEKFSS